MAQGPGGDKGGPQEGPEKAQKGQGPKRRPREGPGKAHGGGGETPAGGGREQGRMGPRAQ